MPNLVTVVGENTHILPHMLKHYKDIVDKVYVAVYRQSDDDTILEKVEELGIEPFMVFTEEKYNWERVTEIYNAIKQTKPNDWQWAFGVNVMGVLHGIQAFVPAMMAHGEDARIINTCSGNGAFINLPSTPIYTSSKASVSSITEVLKLQLEQAESNIKVSILFPGPHTVRTKLFSAERNRPEELARDPNAPDHPISSVEDMLEMMSSMGIEMETTEPEEVASFCLGEIKKSNYWINPVNEKSEQAFKDRVESILTRSDLPNPNIF